MTKILTISDDPIPTGYGRISVEVNRRLAMRGYQITALGLPYDGLLPPSFEGQPLPYWVGALAGKPNWVEAAVAVINVVQPDIVHVIQDAPYAEQIRNTPLDWSRFAFMVTTPVDGAPVYKRWIDMLKQADGTLSISEFGVNAHRTAGVASELLRPGVDANRFFPVNADQRRELRARVGIGETAFVLGTFAMNQGRKSIPHMLDGFFKFAADKPDARYVLDMEATSPAGWDLNDLCQQNGWDAGRLIYREALLRAGLLDMRDRYALLDAHAVLAHREGYGLPLCEAMACGVVSMALDYCSGTEICGDGQGVLVKPIAYTSVSTWGNALDYHPDIADFVAKLQHLYDHPHERLAIAERGMLWARQQTWDAAADAVQRVIERVMQKRRMIPPPNVTPAQIALIEGMQP